MSLPASFSNNTTPTGVQLDNNFAAVASMALWNTTATGTNSIALTTTSNQPAVSAYTDRQRFFFVGPNNSTNSVTVAINSLSALPLYLPSGVQAGSGDIGSGKPYTIVYLAALNANAGGFQIMSSLPSSGNVPYAGARIRGLLMVNNSSTPTTKIDITGDNTILITTGGTPLFVSSVSVTCDLTTTGANGMDTGARPTSGWVYMYVISNGSVTASLGCATSPTSAGPSMPGGYTYAAYAGAMWLDGSQNLFRQRQRSRRTQYVVTAATNTTVPPVIANGTAGTWSATNPTLAAVSVTSVVPLTAGVVFIVNTMKYHAGSAAHILAAPNTSWGGTGNGPAGSNNQGWPVSTDTAAPNQLSMASFILEATTVAWASDAAGGAISGFGWEDSYSAG